MPVIRINLNCFSLPHESITAAMKRQGVGVREMGRRMNDDPSNVSKRLKGKLPLTVDYVARMAEALGISPLPYVEEVAVHEVRKYLYAKENCK